MNNALATLGEFTVTKNEKGGYSLRHKTNEIGVVAGNWVSHYSTINNWLKKMGGAEDVKIAELKRNINSLTKIKRRRNLLRAAISSALASSKEDHRLKLGNT